jgi:hypothetical protein
VSYTVCQTSFAESASAATMQNARSGGRPYRAAQTTQVNPTNLWPGARGRKKKVVLSFYAAKNIPITDGDVAVLRDVSGLQGGFFVQEIVFLTARFRILTI